MNPSPRLAADTKFVALAQAATGNRETACIASFYFWETLFLVNASYHTPHPSTGPTTGSTTGPTVQCCIFCFLSSSSIFFLRPFAAARSLISFPSRDFSVGLLRGTVNGLTAQPPSLPFRGARHRIKPRLVLLWQLNLRRIRLPPAWSRLRPRLFPASMSLYGELMIYRSKWEGKNEPPRAWALASMPRSGTRETAEAT